MAKTIIPSKIPVFWTILEVLWLSDFYKFITEWDFIYESQFFIKSSNMNFLFIYLTEQNQGGFSTKKFLRKYLAWFELNLCVSVCVHEYIG